MNTIKELIQETAHTGVSSDEQKKEPKCIICGKKCFADGVSVPIHSITESGKIIDTNSNKCFSIETVVPICIYHMILIEQEVGFFTKDSFVTREKTNYYESKPNEELKEIINNSLKMFNLNKKKIEKQKMMTELKLAIIIDNARDTEIKFNKEVSNV
jgi:hypothetical protein